MSSHSSTMLSPFPVASVCPSGLNTILLTLPVCPASAWMFSPVVTSHKRMIPFKPACPELADSNEPEKRGRTRNLHISEVMTLLVDFHQSRYRTFKDYYQKHVCLYLRWTFPKLVSYNRFVELTAEALLSLTIYLSRRFGKCSGISFIDSTPIRVCQNRRIPNHRVFAEQAELGKTLSVGYMVSNSISSVNPVFPSKYLRCRRNLLIATYPL